jgi:FlaA1/EpsC-like NDP-sugar epimerase
LHAGIPLTIVLLDLGITVIVICSARSAGRLFREHVRPQLRLHLQKQDTRKVLLHVADRSGLALIHQIHAHPRLHYRIVGVLSSDETMLDTRPGGILVMGGAEDAAMIARTTTATEVLVVAGSLSGKRFRKLLEECDELGIALKVITNVDDLVHNRTSSKTPGFQLRDVDIDDLLHRDPVVLDTPALAKFITGRTVMVTGAGGSIGSEICRQVLAFAPKTLLLVERAENNLFDIDRELRGRDTGTHIEPFLADITDEARLRQLFERHRPEILFHAAAHKHVPMMEANPGEALKNNVGGTRLLADLAHEFDLSSFVLISTDKAVNPSSIMGLSKQICETYVHALAQRSKTRLVVVRFGNVLGSTGSVVPIFQQQIRNGGPVTITHPEMRRYFMTIAEAAQLVLQAASMGKGGEIYELDMGEPVRILDLAEDMIRLSGLSREDIDIVFTGVRPGEKLFEELYLAEETTLTTSHPKVRCAYALTTSMQEARRLLGELELLAQESDPQEIHRRLRELLPSFKPQGATWHKEPAAVLRGPKSCPATAVETYSS